VTVSFGGKTYVNHGLVAVGWLPAATRDFKGESLGSFSSMALSNWKKNADGSYSGMLAHPAGSWSEQCRAVQEHDRLRQPRP
jgi:hypothetical protein